MNDMIIVLFLLFPYLPMYIHTEIPIYLLYSSAFLLLLLLLSLLIYYYIIYAECLFRILSIYVFRPFRLHLILNLDRHRYRCR